MMVPKHPKLRGVKKGSITWYSDVSIFVWSSFACMEAIFGLAGLVVVNTTCLSDRTIGIELTDSAKERLLLVGELGDGGSESSEERKWVKNEDKKCEIELKKRSFTDLKECRYNVRSKCRRAPRTSGLRCDWRSGCWHSDSVILNFRRPSSRCCTTSRSARALHGCRSNELWKIASIWI